VTAQVGNPFPFFYGRNGLPLDGGTLYLGIAGDDPETDPIDVYLDDALTIPAAQPISIIGGMPSHDGNPALFYVDGDNYSLRARDSSGAEVLFVASAIMAESWQPLDSDLTSIAALSTTSFGRGVLTQADAAALRTYIGLVASLPLTGGTVTGSIIRSGAGSYVYAGDASTTIRVFITANGAADPTSAENDIWLELEP
jgi:hypothetical protein